MDIWLATSNSGKVKEFQSLLMDIGANVHDVSEIEFYRSPIESGQTFEANALIKAKSLAVIKRGFWVVADDSGLEVEGLNNLPGIHSARYAGDNASDAMNVAKLLKMLKIRSTNRNAQFQCALVAISPQGEVYHFKGTLKGSITLAPQGQGGFGYDPIFVPENETQTLGQLPPSVKNKISHRAQAIKAFKEFLNNQ
ncbi:MAG: RdgB/HAM1 family non-canonical purine NTP pyrophosphatase [Bdellovibrionales bacterium]|nr:RdgB/HAM1 family non-canonical purine NTP pyrophosphatase [Bdellovibrionales bacterium]